MFPPIRAAILEALELTVHQNYYADKVLQKILRSSSKFGSRDRREVAETFYDIVRHFRLLQSQAGESLEDIVDYYLENKEKVLHDRASFDVSVPVRESVQDDFYGLMLQELGEERTQRELEAMNEMAPVCLRTNTLLTDRKTLMQALQDEGIETFPAENDVGVFLKERKNVFTTKAFKSGFFEVQDYGSQKIAAFLQLQPGQRVVDACAGAGGKSLHMAAAMQNKGRILSLDIHEWKLQELKLRARRAKAALIELRPITSTKIIKRLENSADRLLLDVPCSGSGVLRRNPDSKIKWSPEQFANLQKTQSEILHGYGKMLKPGGKMVYATCSILPSENQRQVEAFLAAHTDWQLEESFTLFPSEGPHDGFFAARLVRK